MTDIKPFIVTGLALGSVYSLSGVGAVVLYRTTAVVNLAYGATGAVGALVAWDMIEHGRPEPIAWLVCVLVSTALSVAYGVIVAPRLALRDQTVNTASTLGFALLLLGFCNWHWRDISRSLSLPTDDHGFSVLGVRVVATKLLALAAALLITVTVGALLRHTRIGLKLRAMANDRELSSMLGIPVASVGVHAWLLSGVLAGLSGLLVADLVRLDAGTLTFLVIPAIAAAVIGRLVSLPATVAGGLAVGLAESLAVPFRSISAYRGVAPFAVSIVFLLWRQRHASLAGRR